MFETRTTSLRITCKGHSILLWQYSDLIGLMIIIKKLLFKDKLLDSYRLITVPTNYMTSCVHIYVSQGQMY